MMKNIALGEQLTFLITQRGVNEATILAQAVSKGISLLYQEAITEAYLLGTISREQALKTLGTDTLEEIEYQRDALKRDVEWGLSNDSSYH
ncbi:MAG: hypothetical protein VSS75_025245 [Candidatus Parabeggiatoa sp.]|nr:hypothetical protein [Candidatus Parabeggiatoa sp.]